MTATTLSEGCGVVDASPAHTAAIVADVLAPLVARGLVVRRPRVMHVAERVDADRRAVRRLQQVRDRYGVGPVCVRLPGRTLALVLSPEDAHRVLAESPDPFALATKEKAAALSRFQPHGVLVSRGPERDERRRFNEAVLDSDRPVHSGADAIVAKVLDEVDGLLATVAERGGRLDHDTFVAAWWRMVRRVVLGDVARDDDALTDELRRLRRHANWAYVRPERRAPTEHFLAAVRAYVGKAEPGSLAELVATVPATADTAPDEQVPQWLFAFDAAGLATLRTLALLSTHLVERARALDEVAGRDLSRPADLPHLRACVLDTLRLWPTTPAILRESTRDTAWRGTTLPAGVSLVLHAPFLHRDGTRLPFADRFAPEAWRDGEGQRPEDWPLVPFSGGPGACPGRNLVLLVTSVFIGALLQRAEVAFDHPERLSPARALPGTFDPFCLTFTVTPTA